MSIGCTKHRAAVGRSCKTSLSTICNDGERVSQRDLWVSQPESRAYMLLPAGAEFTRLPLPSMKGNPDASLVPSLASHAPAGRPQAVPVSPALPKPAQLAARKYTRHGQRPGTKKCGFQHVTKVRMSEDGSGFEATRAVVCACQPKAVRR